MKSSQYMLSSIRYILVTVISKYNKEGSLCLRVDCVLKSQLPAELEKLMKKCSSECSASMHGEARFWNFQLDFLCDILRDF